MKLTLLICVLAATAGPFAGAAVAQETHDDHDGHAETGPGGHAEDGPVVLTPDEIVEFGIETAVAGPGLVEEFVHLPGEVHPNDDRLAHIVPRYSGIVTEVRAKLGDRVRRGDVLAVVESDESLAPYEIRTLIDGTVIEKHITLGEAASRDRSTFAIADLATVWIDLTVYQRDIDRVRVGQAAFILTGHEPPDAAGAISYVTPILDEATRTATARVVLPNGDGRWRPGMFVTGRVLVGSHPAPVVVPRTAVHRVGEHPAVFLRDGDGFRAQDVALGREGADGVEITAGLDPGQVYVSAGGFTLKAELEKGAFGDGHNH